MKTNRPGQLDTELLIAQLFAILKTMPPETCDVIIVEVRRRIAAGSVPASDPDIDVLHEWAMMSTRCHRALVRHLSTDHDEGPRKPIMLSDLARMLSSELLSIPNLGRNSYIEILMILDLYGSRLQDNDATSPLAEEELTEAREKMEARMAKCRASLEQDRMLLDRMHAPDFDWHALTERLGKPERALRAQFAIAARRIAFLRENPVKIL